LEKGKVKGEHLYVAYGQTAVGRHPVGILYSQATRRGVADLGPDHMLCLALVRLLEIVGEAARGVSSSAGSTSNMPRCGRTNSTPPSRWKPTQLKKMAGL
jgi:hypothetical protein